MESQTQTQTFSNTLPTIEKLQAHTDYEISRCKEVQSKFAQKAFIVYDDITQKWYWANSVLNKHLKAHLDEYEKDEKDNCNEIGITLFVHTGGEKVFEKDGKTISYINMYINDDAGLSCHWLLNATSRPLEESTRYEFVKAKKIDTKYGPSFALFTKNGDRYRSCKRINDFIRENIAYYEPDEIIEFEKNLIAETGKYKTFVKDGKEIKYIEARVMY